MKKIRKNHSMMLGVKIVMIVGVAIVLGVVLWLATGVWNKKNSDRGLPVMEISLNGVSLEEINENDKDIKYEGNDLKVSFNNKVIDYSGIEIKGRGNSTWMYKKKPYRLKFDKSVDLFGLGKSKKWNLLANYPDETNLRNEVAFYLEDMIGMQYRLEGKYVELYVDGDYRGLYYLTHVVEIGDNEVALKDPMGILMELDNVHNVREKCYKTGNDDIMTVKSVVNKNNENEAIDSFLQSYNELEIAVRERNYEKISEIVDVESVVQYYLLSEFTVNPDAYVTSFYFYKDGINDKIHFGPGWDFDLALGNRNWENWLGERFYSPSGMMVRKLELTLEEWMNLGYKEEDFDNNMSVSRIVFDMIEIPEFQIKVREIYNERMSGRRQELVTRIMRMAEAIREAVKADEKKWRENENKKDFKNETNTLIDWVIKRYDYFEMIYGDSEKELNGAIDMI